MTEKQIPIYVHFAFLLLVTSINIYKWWLVSATSHTLDMLVLLPGLLVCSPLQTLQRLGDAISSIHWSSSIAQRWCKRSLGSGCYKHSTALGAARFEGRTKSILRNPALSEDCAPQLEGEVQLRVCSLLRMTAQIVAAQKLHFIFASLKQRKEGLLFFVTYNENKGEVGKPHLLPGSTFYYPFQQEERFLTGCLGHLLFTAAHFPAVLPLLLTAVFWQGTVFLLTL